MSSFIEEKETDSSLVAGRFARPNNGVSFCMGDVKESPFFEGENRASHHRAIVGSPR